jgi:hypothetical protein
MKAIAISLVSAPVLVAFVEALPRPQYVAQQHVLRTCSGFRVPLQPASVFYVIGRSRFFFNTSGLKKTSHLPITLQRYEEDS